MTPWQRRHYSRYIRAARVAITNGVVDANNATRQKYCRNWCAYVQPLHIDPFLQTTSAREVILVTTWFIDRVRRGYYGNVKCVTFQTPQVALSAIYNTIKTGGWCQPHILWRKQVHNPNPPPNVGLMTWGPTSHTKSRRPGHHSQLCIQNWKKQQHRSIKNHRSAVSYCILLSTAHRRIHPN